MKYLDAKFNTPGNSRAYVEGWERVFGDGEGEACARCGIVEDDSHDHPGLCCDCYDLSWFPENLELINEERQVKGRPPITHAVAGGDALEIERAEAEAATEEVGPSASVDDAEPNDIAHVQCDVNIIAD